MIFLCFRNIEFMDLCLIDMVKLETPPFELSFYEKDEDSIIPWKKCEGKLKATESLTIACVTHLPEFSSDSYNFSGFLHYTHENDLLFAKIDIDVKASEIIEDVKNPILCNINSFSKNIFHKHISKITYSYLYLLITNIFQVILMFLQY